MMSFRASTALVLFVLLALAVLAESTEAKNSKSNPSNTDSHPNQNWPDIDSLIAHAFEVADVDGICAKDACETEHMDDLNACTPPKIDTYRSRCAQVMAGLGIKRPSPTVDPDRKEQLKQHLANVRRKFQDEFQLEMVPEMWAQGYEEIIEDEL
ncbi:hypothetical protein K505DRAFT_330011 [Melanomma pulvis-pyrius CBS 109.77]|uniref:Uncharacterized protein n=1 Tax=Melanomma pulvis-pyrius CBS 109.77 TaxID=1314802 RepID=A0A6A6WS45_9PLEO|nr:hypothetical protein K505DRAFT_330011 [Melanomma pulvis-pyrius CBS 109.77]